MRSQLNKRSKIKINRTLAKTGDTKTLIFKNDRQIRGNSYLIRVTAQIWNRTKRVQCLAPRHKNVVPRQSGLFQLSVSS